MRMSLLHVVFVCTLTMREFSEENVSACKLSCSACKKFSLVLGKGVLAARRAGTVVQELTGDMQLSKKELAETQVIVTTPEKWDVITRKGGDVAVAQAVKLLIIDEVHLLNDERGPVIETLIARTQRQVRTPAALPISCPRMGNRAPPCLAKTSDTCNWRKFMTHVLSLLKCSPQCVLSAGLPLLCTRCEAANHAEQGISQCLVHFCLAVGIVCLCITQ